MVSEQRPTKVCKYCTLVGLFLQISYNEATHYLKLTYAISCIKSSPNLCVNSSFSYVVLSTLLLSSKDLTEWSLVYHSTLSYQRFYDLHSIHYDHLEGLHQLI